LSRRVGKGNEPGIKNFITLSMGTRIKVHRPERGKRGEKRGAVPSRGLNIQKKGKAACSPWGGGFDARLSPMKEGRGKARVILTEGKPQKKRRRILEWLKKKKKEGFAFGNSCEGGGENKKGKRKGEKRIRGKRDCSR